MLDTQTRTLPRGIFLPGANRRRIMSERPPLTDEDIVKLLSDPAVYRLIRGSEKTWSFYSYENYPAVKGWQPATSLKDAVTRLRDTLECRPPHVR